MRSLQHYLVAAISMIGAGCTVDSVTEASDVTAAPKLPKLEITPQPLLLGQGFTVRATNLRRGKTYSLDIVDSVDSNVSSTLVSADSRGVLSHDFASSTIIAEGVYRAVLSTERGKQTVEAAAHEFTVADPSQERVAALSAGIGHMCARLTTGRMLCWGGNWIGQLGRGTMTRDGLPDPASVLAETGAELTGVITMHTGDETPCAVMADGSARCWGWNVNGMLGDGTENDSAVPVRATQRSDYSVVVPSRTATCAITRDREVLCWGNNYFGQLGDGTRTDRNSPAPVTGLSADVVQLAGSEGHYCALHATGTVSCWGWGSSGQLGNGSNATYQTTPVEVSNLQTAVSIGVGQQHSCAVLSSGQLVCWGANDSGQLGDGTTTYRNVPDDVVGLTNVAQVSAGYVHTCARTSDGNVFCFGWDGAGSLGDGGDIYDEVDEQHTPTQVLNLSDAVQITANNGGDFYCALRATGAVSCWGDGFYGQLGPEVLTREWQLAFAPVDIPGLP